MSCYTAKPKATTAGHIGGSEPEFTGLTPKGVESIARQFAPVGLDARCAARADGSVLLRLQETAEPYRQAAGTLTERSTLGSIAALVSDLADDVAASGGVCESNSLPTQPRAVTPSRTAGIP